jgi:uncharacterized lipoprotein
VKQLVISALLGFIILLNSGCATLADAKAAKGTGTVKTYEQPYDLVWDTLVSVIKETKLKLVSESKDAGTMLAQGAMSAFSYGENVAVFIEDVGEKQKTRVEIVNKRALATNITAADWEGRLFKSLDQRLLANPQP